MKKIISLVLALVIAIGCVACSSVGETTTESTEPVVDTDSESTAPVVDTNYEIYDTSTKEGITNAVIHSPDYNANDNFWYWFTTNKVHNYNENMKPNFYTVTSRSTKISFGLEYTEKGDSISHRFEKPFYVDFQNDEEFKTTLETVNSKRETGAIKPVAPKSTFNSYYLYILNDGVYDWDSATDMQKECLPIGDEPLTEKEFYEGLGIDTESESFKNADEAKVIETLANVNYFNEWCKANDLIYDMDRDITDRYFSTENGDKNHLNEVNKIIGYATNYLEAKYEGAELTTPIADKLAPFANMDVVHDYLNKQGIGSNNNLNINTCYGLMENAFPVVYIEYDVVNEDKLLRAENRVFFIFNRTKTGENAYDYEIAYIISVDEYDTHEEAFKAFSRDFKRELADEFGLNNSYISIRLDDLEYCANKEYVSNK